VEDAMRAEVTKIERAAQANLNLQVAPRVRGNYRGWHAHLVNFGTKVRQTKMGWNRGAARENNFAQRAFDRTINQVRPDFEAQVAKSTERLLKQNIVPKL